MTYTMRNKIRSWWLSIWCAILFSGGILFGGAEWKWPGIPWGPVIGVGCFAALGITVLIIRDGIE
jgi:hypothetical protein